MSKLSRWRSARLARALILAPLVAPILFWAGSLLSALADPNRRRAALNAPLDGLGLVLALGGAIAYAATLVAALPAIWLLRQGGHRTLVGLLALGAVVGLATAAVIGPELRGDLFSVLLPATEGAVLGSMSAAAFWWLATDSAASTPPRS